jgi:thymidylate kinase
MVALIGVDGAGKSTMAAELTDWLSWRVHVPFYYLGSKQPSPWTEWSYLLFRIARRGHRELSSLLGERHWLPLWLVRLRQTLVAAHYLFVGRDRYRRYLRARAQVAGGAVVIFDRYPFSSPLDGPEIDFIDGGRLNPMAKRMARREHELYQKYEPVDLLILLEISPEAAQGRKPDHALETIRSKQEALAGVKAKLKLEAERWDWVCIDAQADPEEVLLEIKRSLWVAL